MEADGREATAVVLVRPREEGNVGSAARAMANMGLGRLVLVEPAPAFGDVAKAFAVGAGHVLQAAVRAASVEAALAPFARVIGTTSARDRRLGVPPLTARALLSAREVAILRGICRRVDRKLEE